ncbi:MAG: hypothetical protein ACR2NO_10485 [Chloroflexota bacterium]
MARTLSDTLIVAVLEAATRLTGARGAIAGSAAANAAQTASAPSTGDPVDAPTAGAAPAGTNPSDAALANASKGDSPPNAGAEHDSRSAEQIAADFRKIYAQIEELVRGSAEQETKSVGFGRG